MHALAWLLAITLSLVGPAPVRATDAVRAGASAPAPAASFRWPLDGTPRVVRRFAPPPSPWLAGHRGVDLAAYSGAVVRAAGGGTVHFAGRVAGRGVVSINHPSGLRTTYEPVEPTVRAGQALAAGDRIGTLVAGHADCAAAACLHWGLRRGEEYLDPLALLGLGRVRLLPLTGPAPSRRPASSRSQRAACPQRADQQSGGPAGVWGRCAAGAVRPASQPAAS